MPPPRTRPRRARPPREGAPAPGLRRVTAGIHAGHAPPRGPLDRRADPHARDAERAHDGRRLALPRSRGTRLLRVPERAALLLARRPRVRDRDVLDILDGALARAGGKATPFGAFLDSALDRVGEGAMLGVDRADLRPPGEHDRARLRDRRDRRLVPRLLHAGEGGAARAQGRRRPRQPRRTRGRDHRRARARALGRAPVGDLPAHRHRLGDRAPADPRASRTQLRDATRSASS